MTPHQRVRWIRRHRPEDQRRRLSGALVL